MAFSYYGRKKRLAPLYPAAIHDTIVEPFAGSAAYSCQPSNLSKRVILYDKDPSIIECWERIVRFTEDDFARFAALKRGDKSDDLIVILHSISKRWYTYRSTGISEIIDHNLKISLRWWPTLIPQIQHWEFVCGDYTDCPDIEATWFVDPPYPGEPGTGYRFGSDLIDFNSLGEWALARKGQLIACSGATDTWLPFAPFQNPKGLGTKRYFEGLYTRERNPEMIDTNENVGCVCCGEAVQPEEVALCGGADPICPGCAEGIEFEVE